MKTMRSFFTGVLFVGSMLLTGCKSDNDTVNVESIVIVPSEKTMSIGQTFIFTARILPEQAGNKQIVWSVDRPDVIAIEPATGQVEALSSGNAVLTATARNGIFATCLVTVTASSIPVTGVSVSPATLSLSVGEKRKLTAEVLPANADNKTVIWQSDNPAVASVDQVTGEVEALSTGSAVVSATTQEGLFAASCKVAVGFGARWTKVNIDTDKSLNDIYFVDDAVGFIAGDDGIVFKTTDGGNNWSKLSGLDRSQNNLSLWFTDRHTGVVANLYGRIYRTEDGGATWTEVFANSSYEMYAMRFLDRKTGFGVGSFVDNAAIMKTIDGGKNWSVMTLNYTKQGHGNVTLMSVDFIDSQTGYAVGHESGSDNYGLVLKTTDGGLTWNEQEVGKVEAELTGICFIDSRIGYITGGNCWHDGRRMGMVMKTTDGGNSWSTVYIDTQESVEKVYFVNSQVGYIAGLWNSVLKTTDGGSTWHPIVIAGIGQNGSWVSSCWFTGEDTGFVIGFGGMVYKMEKP